MDSETPEFNGEYHRARRNLTFTSALLLGWEFIGFELGSKLKVPGAELPVQIENPDIIPYALVFFVVFFGIRYWIEWKQAPTQRTELAASKIDVFLASLIGFTSLLLFWYQALSGVNVGAKIVISDFRSWSGFVNLGFVVCSGAYAYIYRRYYSGDDYRLLSDPINVFFFFVSGLNVLSYFGFVPAGLYEIIFGITVITLIVLLVQIYVFIEGL